MSDPLNMVECPRCGSLLDPDIEMNALSRRDNESCICSHCGQLEALEDAFALPCISHLPKFCYGHDHRNSPKTIMVIRGVCGYFKTTGSVERTDYRELNNKIGVDEKTADEMMTMSMFGFTKGVPE